MRNSLILALLLLSRLASGSQVVFDFPDGWKIWDPYYQDLLPVSQKYLSGDRLLFLELPVSISQGDLEFMAPPELSLFVDGKLIYRRSMGAADSLVRIPLSFLHENHSTGEFILIGAHGQFSPQMASSFRIRTYFSNKQMEEREQDSPYAYFLKAAGSLQGLLAIAVVVVLLLLNGLRLAEPGRGGRRFSLIPDDDQAQMVGSLHFFIRVILSSFLLAILGSLFYQDGGALGWKAVDTLFHNKTVFGNVSSLFFVFIFMQLVKFIVIRFLAGLIGFASFAQVHYYLFTNLLYYLSLFVFGALLVLQWQNAWTTARLASYLPHFGAILIVLVTVISGYNLWVREKLRNIRLISYFCTAEIIPGLIAVKFLIF
jgi:hypothetical protein